MGSCADLGRWIVEPVYAPDQQVSMLSALDDVERVSAFVVQTPLGNVLIRRERASRPALHSDPAQPHWNIQEYSSPIDAAIDAYQKGGWIYSTNGGDTAAVRIWYASCGDEPVHRRVITH